MNKNELTKVLFPYAMEAAKTFKLTDEEMRITIGEIDQFCLSDIAKANEFMNTCIEMFIQDVARNFTIQDLAKFIKTAYTITNGSFSGYVVNEHIEQVPEKNETSVASNKHVQSENPHCDRQHKGNSNVWQMSLFDDTDASYIVDERPGTAHKSTCSRIVTKHVSRKRVVGNVVLYSSIEALKAAIPTVKDRDIYRVAGMVPGKGEFMEVPPMYYVSANGKNLSVARKSYREFAHKHYETLCRVYKNKVGYAFGYSLTCKSAYKKIK